MAIDFGYDASGRGNNWTVNNLSSTAGAGNDSLTDTPTSYGTDTGVGGEVRGNYCTVNPLDIGGLTLANGNLDVTRTSSTADWDTGRCTIQIPDSGKWYWEMTFNSGSNDGCFVGVGTNSANLTQEVNGFWAYQSAGYIIYNGSFTTATALSTGDVVMVAFDRDANKLWFGRNGTWGLNGGSPVTPTDPNSNFTNLPASLTPSVGARSTSSASYNFGQRAFAYTAPSGFKALCTQNLPTPTIGATSTTQANDYFDVSLWTGTGVAQNITNSGSMQPDFVWTKTRSQANDNFLFDAVRGVGKYIVSNSTAAEATVAQTLTAFNSNGFSVGTDNDTNASGRTFVGWQWRAAGSTVTNTAGTITSTVSANTTSGFSIVTYTGTGANATVGHGLGVAPRMVIVKGRSFASNWNAYNSNLTSASYYIRLNTTAAQENAQNFWNSTAPTSTVFSLSSEVDVNSSGNTFVAYCFAPVAGYSAFGSYNSNASSDGPFIYTGFRPRFVMIKKATGSVNANAGWYMFDTARGTYNVIGPYVQANLSDAETTGPIIDTLSNGFKLRIVDISVNGSTAGDTYIYMAFAEFPFKFSLAR